MAQSLPNLNQVVKTVADSQTAANTKPGHKPGFFNLAARVNAADT